MPYISSTPEALAARLIGRSDSRNPATTCRGISISTGKPCRRSIASKAPNGYKKSSPSASSQGGEGSGDGANPAEEFFCWQHKDQAADTVVLHRSESQKMRRLEGRSSLDTLVEVILGPEAGEDGGSAGVGPGQTEVIIRRETLLGDDEVMVVRKNTIVKKDAKIVKEARKKGEGKRAVWDALHGQNKGSPETGGLQHPIPSHGSSKRPQHSVSANRISTQSMGPIMETPVDTYPPNNELKQPTTYHRPQPTASYQPQRRPSLLAQLFCCLNLDESSPPPPVRPQAHNQHQPHPQMQPARPQHVQDPPPPMPQQQQHNMAMYPNFTPYHQPPPIQPPIQVQTTPIQFAPPPPPPQLQRPIVLHPELNLPPTPIQTIRFSNPRIFAPPLPPPQAIFPPNIHSTNGWDDPSIEAELSSSSDEDSDDDTQTVIIPAETRDHLNPILPSHLSAKTRALITTEMNKPISQKDMPGYIYIFWLKDESAAPPPPAAPIGQVLSRGMPVPAPSAPPSSFPSAPQTPPNKSSRKYSYIRDPGSAALFRAVDDDYSDDDEATSPTAGNRRSRGASITTTSTTTSSTPREKRVLLKIGRAQNVQRRLHQWSQQCGYNLQLLRYYPYVPLGSAEASESGRGKSPTPGSTATGVAAEGGNTTTQTGSGKPAQKVPFSHRVERLIHLELRDDYYNKPHVCETCKRIHKEWFAVPGNRDGVKRVDEVIKRWCRWAEGVEGAVNRREQGVVSDGLGHRRGDSGSTTGERDKVVAGVRGVERMVWREGYVEEEAVADDGEDEEGRRRRLERAERMGTFGFL
ncbi:hypothetical protein TWF694_006437 [Orbilia ellipsospora]|uniref:Bacteriophage T5 Orf172 DNA-binding domain-containing protein n=1 Tax=Orbilia ellipsospora TaxID=2528407 RepID=A0AAV9XK17_9PEZI